MVVATCGPRCMWVDRFGNLQLAATVADAEWPSCPRPGRPRSPSTSAPSPAAARRPDPTPGTTLRRVETFADLARGELGLLIDANGHLAVVAGQASAARALDVGAGRLVVLTW